MRALFQRWRRTPPPEPFEGSPFVDLHCHVIPGVDDGARDIEEAIGMIERLSAFGIGTIVATPHIMAGRFPNRREGLSERLAALQEALSERGIPMRLELGAEHCIDSSFVEGLEAKALVTLGVDSNHVLCEFPHWGVPEFLEEILFECQLKGYIPVIAHPERYPEKIDGEPTEDFLRDRGCLLQLDITSFSPFFAARVRKRAHALLKRGAGKLLASDCHDPAKSFEAVRSGFARLRKIVSEELLREMYVENPEKIRTGKSLG